MLFRPIDKRRPRRFLRAMDRLNRLVLSTEKRAREAMSSGSTSERIGQIFRSQFGSN